MMKISLLYKIILCLSLLCAIFSIYSTHNTAIIFNKSFIEVLYNNAVFLLWAIFLAIFSYYKNLLWMILITIIEITYSFFFDAVWILKWASFGVFGKLAFINKSFVLFFSGIASLSCLLILVILIILIIAQLMNMKKKINSNETY